MTDQIPNKQKENINRELREAREVSIFITTAVFNTAVAAILIKIYGLTQRLEANPFVVFSIASIAFFAIMGLLIYQKKKIGQYSI
jgi:hypothetical protein